MRFAVPLRAGVERRARRLLGPLIGRISSEGNRASDCARRKRAARGQSRVFRSQTASQHLACPIPSTLNTHVTGVTLRSLERRVSKTPVQ